MPLAMALSVTTAMVPQALAQTALAAPPTRQQTQPPSQAQQPLAVYSRDSPPEMAANLKRLGIR